jgi:putative NADH-flavin reductase
LTIVQGDINDDQAVRGAIQGADAVISALGPVKDSPKDLLLKAQQHIVSAMQAAQVHRYVMVTGAGVRDPQDQPKFIDHVFGFLLCVAAADVLRDSVASVKVVQASSLDWVIVRGPRLVDGPYTGRYRVGYVGKQSGTQISRADLADFMLRQATGESNWIHRLPVVSN